MKISFIGLVITHVQVCHSCMHLPRAWMKLGMEPRGIWLMYCVCIICWKASHHCLCTWNFYSSTFKLRMCKYVMHALTPCMNEVGDGAGSVCWTEHQTSRHSRMTFLDDVITGSCWKFFHRCCNVLQLMCSHVMHVLSRAWSWVRRSRELLNTWHILWDFRMTSSDHRRMALIFFWKFFSLTVEISQDVHMCKYVMHRLPLHESCCVWITPHWETKTNLRKCFVL